MASTPTKTPQLRCKACGDAYRPDDYQPSYWDKMPAHERAYCRDCHDEVYAGIVPKATTLQHDTGGGQRVLRDSKTLS